MYVIGSLLMQEELSRVYSLGGLDESKPMPTANAREARPQTQGKKRLHAPHDPAHPKLHSGEGHTAPAA